MHINSITAYDELIPTLNARESAVLDIVINAKKPLTNYDILQKFKPGSDNLNLVAPRITSLHDKGVLIEGAPARSHAKNTQVRTSILSLTIPPQQELFSGL